MSTPYSRLREAAVMVVTAYQCNVGNVQTAASIDTLQKAFQRLIDELSRPEVGE